MLKLPQEIPLRKIKKMLQKVGARCKSHKGNHMRWTRKVGKNIYNSTLQADDPVRKDVYQNVFKQLGISKKQLIQFIY